MKKEFIAPSFEVKMFNKECLITASGEEPVPTPEPGSNLKNAQVSVEGIQSVTITL